ncbi:hypothetical protein D9M72_579100 [compost metagenome]
MGGVDVEEAATIGAELLDRLLARDRAERDRLLGAFERRCGEVRVEGLRQAGPDHGKRHDDGDRQQHVEGRTGEIDPEIADG